MASSISYCDKVWPVTAGCTVVSDGCANCWSMRLAATRLKHHADYQGLARRTDKGHYQWTGDVRLLEHNLDIPLHWRRPRVIFVNSQSDLFHEAVPDEFIDRVFAVMALSSRHTFLVLTKRPERKIEWFGAKRYEGVMTAMRHMGIDVAAIRWPLPNVILGVTAENQAEADRRIPILLQTPAAKRWVSIEPMLGSIKLGWDESTGSADDGALGLDWVVLGSESGPNARPFDVDWARSVRDQCQAAGVKYYLKQLPAPKGIFVHPRDQRPKAILHSPTLDGRQWLEVPW